MQPMGGTTLKTLGIIAVLSAGAVYLNYGTLSPCGALRESVRKQDALARILPDVAVDAIIEGNVGPLTPERCLGVLISGQRPPAQVAAPVPAPAPASLGTAQANPMTAAGNEMIAAINECRGRRLAGELKTFVASAQCANPRITQAFSKANYRYMDLVTLMAVKRMQISERLDRKEISEADANVQLQQAFTDVVTAEKLRDASTSARR
jgi:hypothetical protein